MKKFIATVIMPLSFLFTSSFIGPVVAASNSTEKHVSDSMITSKIKAKYAEDKLLKSLDISVSTRSGEAVLSGEVDSTTQYEQAISLAQSVEGVEHVNSNKLSVKSNNSLLADLRITATIKGKLLRAKLFSNKEVAYSGYSIETKNRVVYLKGRVDSRSIRDSIIEIAESVQGVKSVKADLTVSK